MNYHTSYTKEPNEKTIMQNSKAMMAAVKTIEYKVNVLEDLLRQILKEIRECRENEM